MKSGTWKHFALAGLFALVLYAAGYSLIEHMRQRKGGWQVAFSSDRAGEPRVIVTQPALGITNVQLRFSGERVAATNLDELVIFNRPITNAPFGKVIFIDTTFLPGTVAFEFFGHEVQLLPRVLTINLREVPWRSDEVIELRPDRKKPGQVGEPARGAN